MVNVQKEFEKVLGVTQEKGETGVNYKLRIIDFAEKIPYDPEDSDKDEWMKLSKELRDWFNDSVDTIDNHGGEPHPFPEEEETEEEAVDEVTEDTSEQDKKDIEEELAALAATENEVESEEEVVDEKTIADAVAESVVKEEKEIEKVSVHDTEFGGVLVDDEEDEEPDEVQAEIELEDLDEKLLSVDDKAAVLTPAERRRVIETFTGKGFRQNVRKSDLVIDRLGYTRVEAFIDAMKKGGGKDIIIMNSQRNYVAATGEGSVRNIAEATFYYKALQRLCYRLGVIKFDGHLLSFESDELVLVNNFNKALK